MKSFNIVANLKMCDLEEDIGIFANHLQPNYSNINLVLCPSYLHIAALKHHKGFALCAQDCSENNDLSHTGSISAKMLQKAGTSHVIIGHYETRRDFKLTRTQIQNKITNALNNNITPILCIGEEIYLDSQDAAKFILSELQLLIANPRHIWIAYEPVWAIGTGNTPSIPYIKEVIINIKNAIGDDIVFLYGGSINENNCQDFAAIKELDGLVIGSASHNHHRLNNIMNICTIQRREND